MKVVFLDIDGVIATDATYKRWRQTSKREPFGAPLSELHGLIDPVLCDRVRFITEATGAVIVVSSSWRNMFDGAELCAFLGAYMPTPIGCTPERIPRGEAVQQWMEARDVAPADVVLLDDSDCAPMNGRRIQTPERTGIGARHVARAVKLLGYRLSQSVTPATAPGPTE